MIRSLRRAWWPATLGAVLLVGAVAEAQRGGGGRRERGGTAYAVTPNVPYDGRFTFVRLRYGGGQDFGGGFRQRELPWSHDWPRGERNFTKILSELSTMQVRTDASNVLALDDPELFKYPVAYMAEPGFWRPTDSEVESLRKWLAKGGFLIFDDFAGQHFLNFESQMRRVLPQARLVPLTVAHPVFDSFYRIKSLDYNHPYYGVPSVFYGVFEDNDPSKRLLVIANYNNDLSEYWEFSDEGMFPLDLSNEAYKLGINYIIYALTR
jgi:hypothetical protein